MFELIGKVVRVSTLKLVLFAAAFYIASGFFIYFLEPQTFRNPFIGFWWVMTTVTTTGFGDYAPVTVPGMLFGVFLYISGIGLIGVILGKVVDLYMYYGRLKMSGKMKYTGQGHFIIIGWSKNAEKTIQELLEAKNAKRDVVLIGRLSEAPITHDRFHYIRGNPTEPAVLEQANVQKADSVSVFAPEDEDDALTDGKTLLIASAIEKYAAEEKIQIYTIVEIVRERHIRMFRHAHVDEFVLSRDTFPNLMAKTMLHHGSNQFFMQLLSDRYGENLWEIQPDKSWRTYGDAFESLRRQGATLVSAGPDFTIVRRLDDPIPKNARLYIICDEETFEKLDVRRVN